MRGIDGNLALCHLHNLLIIKNLDISPYNLYPYVVTGLFKIGRCSLKIEGVQFYCLVNPESVEDIERSTKGKGCTGSIGIYIGICLTQAPAERKILTCTRRQVRKTAEFRGTQVQLILLQGNVLAFDGQVMLCRIVYATLQIPCTILLSIQTPERTQNREQQC